MSQKNSMKIYQMIISAFIVIIVFISLIVLLTKIDIPIPTDLDLDTNSTMYAGHEEVCLTPLTKIECAEGLVCKLITKKPELNGICLKPEENFTEDFANRDILPNPNNNTENSYIK